MRLQDKLNSARSGCRNAMPGAKKTFYNRLLNAFGFGFSRHGGCSCEECSSDPRFLVQDKQPGRTSVKLPEQGTGQFHVPYFMRMLEKKA